MSNGVAQQGTSNAKNIKQSCNSRTVGFPSFCQYYGNNIETRVYGYFTSLETLLLVQHPVLENFKKSILLIPCVENPSVTNGISTQKASNAKASKTQFQQDYLSRLCHQRLRKDKLYPTGTTRERTGISFYWKLYRWLSDRLQQLHCQCNGVAAVSHQAIDNVC